MPTTETKTVKSAGGDYSSLTAYEAAEQTDLVADDKIKQAELYAFLDDPGIGDGVLWDGWTTDATRYIRAYAASGQQHSGRRDTGYQLTFGGFGHGNDIREDFVRIEGVALVSVPLPTIYGDRGFHIDVGAGADIRLSKIYLSTFTNDRTFCRVFNSSSGIKIWNCMSGFDGTGVHSDDSNHFSLESSGTYYLYNNTVVGHNFGSGSSCFVVENGTPTLIVLKNNIADRGPGLTDPVNAHGYILAGVSTTGSTNNLTDDSTSAPGSNPVHNAVLTYTDVNNGNLHLVSADISGAKNGGADLSADANIPFSDDIDGESRPQGGAAWDIGADEFVPAVATGPVIGGGNISLII